MVSRRFEMALRISESSYCSVHAVYESWVKEPGRLGVVRPVKVPPFLVLVVNDETFSASTVRGDASTASRVPQIPLGILSTF